MGEGLTTLSHGPLKLVRAGPALKRSHFASPWQGKGGSCTGTARDRGRTGERCNSAFFWLQKLVELKPDDICRVPNAFS